MLLYTLNKCISCSVSFDNLSCMYGSLLNTGHAHSTYSALVLLKGKGHGLNKLA